MTTYDPQVDFAAFCQAAGISRGIQSAQSIQEALSGASTVAVLTEWEEFRCIEWAAMPLAASVSIYDGRNILASEAVRSAGFKLHSIGVSVFE